MVYWRRSVVQVALFPALSLCLFSGPKQEITPVVNTQYLPTLLPMIDGAKKSIDFIQLEFHYDPTVKKIQDALRAAAGRGVRVRGLLENNIKFNVKSVEYLKKYGIDAKLDTPEKMTHNKLFIADGKEVILGSTNLSGGSMDRNNETNVRIRDKAIAGYLTRYFEKLWADSETEPNMEPFTSGAITVFTNRSYFKEVSSLLGGAKSSISVLMYGISCSKKDPNAKINKLVDELIAASKKGVKVRVLLDKSNYNDAINAVNARAKERLEAGGVQVRYDDEEVTSHAKLICVDGVVVVGSYNWGRDAVDERNECAVIVRDKAVHEFFLRYFDTLWEGKAWDSERTRSGASALRDEIGLCVGSALGKTVFADGDRWSALLRNI
ncbi:MAG: phospholipase D-like domain-containing protein [Candidatus Aureabacteria bacterium]|nr:phospholipase D-like domain-containing protein [Candidatus Auribacterota bacterium]